MRRATACCGSMRQTYVLRSCGSQRAYAEAIPFALDVSDNRRFPRSYVFLGVASIDDTIVTAFGISRIFGTVLDSSW